MRETSDDTAQATLADADSYNNGTIETIEDDNSHELLEILKDTAAKAERHNISIDDYYMYDDEGDPVLIGTIVLKKGDFTDEARSVQRWLRRRVKKTDNLSNFVNASFRIDQNYIRYWWERF